MAQASFRRFAADVAEHRAALTSVEVAVFDPELWAATPTDEQQDPGSAMASFAETAHELGMRVVITPGLSIAQAGEQAWCPPPETGEPSEESAQDAYLRCNVAGLTAQYAEVVEIQAQELQDDPEAYESFVTKSAAQARAANPDVMVLAGLRTRSSVDMDAVRESWASVLGKIDGHYLAMNPDDAGELLTWIDDCSRQASA